MGKPSDLVQGTLDLLILKTISLEPMHGWAIAKRIQQVSGEVLQVQQGSLYPALHRLEQQAWIKAKWAESETGRQAKFYSLTSAGRAQLEKESANWSRLSDGGMVVSGHNPELNLVEMIELPDHPYFVGCQFHPEFKSKPFAPHPLFSGFIRAALEHRDGGRR